MSTIKEQQQEHAEKLEKDNLETLTVYTIEMGYNKWSTTDKESAFNLWQTLTDGFFILEPLGSSYEGPKFYWKKPVEVKLLGEKHQVWKTYESASKAHAAFEALKPNKE